MKYELDYFKYILENLNISMSRHCNEKGRGLSRVLLIGVIL